MIDNTMDDNELATRSMFGFGEMLAALGRGHAGAHTQIRWPNALGARIDIASGDPWFDAVVVPFGRSPPADDPQLPTCIWTLAETVPGRLENTGIAMPCMGIALDDSAVKLNGGAKNVKVASLDVLGDLNERAYGDFGTFGPLARALLDERIRVHGLHEDGTFVCVALTLSVGDDLAIHYVATEQSHRRRGLASALLLAIMAAARDRGVRSATLQASADGLSVYKRIGFRHVATLRAYLRPHIET